MRKYSYPICGLFIIALAYFTFSGCETTSTGPSGSTAHLTVQRGPKFGSKSVLTVMVDGAKVASVTEGQVYNGTLSPGQHVISVGVTGPNRGAPPTKTIMAEKGQTYSFTATWQAHRLVLL
jgi:LysM repeat protein